MIDAHEHRLVVICEMCSMGLVKWLDTVIENCDSHVSVICWLQPMHDNVVCIACYDLDRESQIVDINFVSLD